MTQIARLSTEPRQLVLLASVAAFVAGPALADMNLRVESRPNTDAIEAFVRVTDDSGPVTGLTAADFAIKLDGAALNTFTLSLPPDQDPTQKVSVVLVVTEPLFTQSTIVAALTDFINQMAVGDYAAIVKFKSDVTVPVFLPVVQPLTRIDGDAGTSILIDFLSTFDRTRRSYVSVFDGLILALDQLVTPGVALPDGPKAIILIGHYSDSFSAVTQGDVVAYANDNGITVFTVGVGNIVGNLEVNALMAALAADTGGTYFTAADGAQIEETLITVAGLLNSTYRLTIPQSAVTDCFPHVLEVTSQGQSENIAFTRCDTTPDEFQFTGQEDVAPGTVVVSDAVTITGIESPTTISVDDGEYSVGCGSTFTAAPGTILPGQQVCVRHTASADFAVSTSTLLIVGGVSSWFWSTTSAAPPPPPPVGGGGGGGGGAVDAVGLLFLLAMLLLRRRRF